jgi:transposase-like protein
MMLHKLRRAMVNASRERLHGQIEVDDTWVGGEQAGLRGSRQLKQRRAALVLVAVEKRGQASGRARMSVIPDFKAATIIKFLTQNVVPGSTIYTDGLKSFSGLPEAGLKHVARNQPLRSDLRKGAKSAVPLADRAIGNLQQWLIGTYHGVSKAQLQVYLDEFVFRHNRRKTPAAAFQTLLGLGTDRTSTEYEQIRGAKSAGNCRSWRLGVVLPKGSRCGRESFSVRRTELPTRCLRENWRPVCRRCCFGVAASERRVFLGLSKIGRDRAVPRKSHPSRKQL